jgi:hypothetical protein
MMKRLLFVPVLALVFAAPALAKGPDSAKVEGPGLKGGGITFGTAQPGDPEPGTPLGDLVDKTGFFAAMFGQTPDPMLTSKPRSSLGPRYTITYRVPGPGGPDTIRQDLYPYAVQGPLTYTKPGQKFFGTERTHGGWFPAPATLKSDLVERGLPASAPRAGGSTDDGFWPLSTGLTATLATALGLALVAAGSIVLMRRRPGAAAAG